MMKQFPIPALILNKGSLKLRNASLMFAAVKVVISTALRKAARRASRFDLLHVCVDGKPYSELAELDDGVCGFSVLAFDDGAQLLPRILSCRQLTNMANGDSGFFSHR